MRVDISQLELSASRRSWRVPAVPISLMEQIEQFGQLDPVIARTLKPGRYEILRNAETWLAIQRLGQFQVDIDVRDNLTNSEAIAIINRPEKLDPIGEAELFRDHLGPDRKRGDVTKLAERYRISRSYVAHALRLLELPLDLQKAVQIGVLKRGHAKALLTLQVADDRKRFGLAIIQKKWSVGRAEKEIRRYLAKESVAKVQRSKSPETKSLERNLTDAIGSAVTIDEIGGTLTINYQGNLEVLDGVINRMTGRRLVEI